MLNIPLNLKIDYHDLKQEELDLIVDELLKFLDCSIIDFIDLLYDKPISEYIDNISLKQ